MAAAVVVWIGFLKGGEEERERKKEGCPVQNVPYCMALWISPCEVLS